MGKTRKTYEEGRPIQLENMNVSRISHVDKIYKMLSSVFPAHEKGKYYMGNVANLDSIFAIASLATDKSIERDLPEIPGCKNSIL